VTATSPTAAAARLSGLLHGDRRQRRCLVMGIINVTPDSFSGDGLLAAAGPDGPVRAALEQARGFIAAGADILDIGGESTRPGAAPVTAAEEQDRLLPVLSALAAAFPGTLLSADTYRAETARLALAAGACIVNDVGGLRDPAMAGVIAETGACAILMHNRAVPGRVERDSRLGDAWAAPDYQDFLSDLAAEMAAMAESARAAGVDTRRIILDPGIGFGKTVAQNLMILNHLERLRAEGFPLLAGPSRKGFISRVLDVPPGGRGAGTAAAVALAVARGAEIVRVHDVPDMVQVVRMADAILRAGAGEPDGPPAAGVSGNG